MTTASDPPAACAAVEQALAFVEAHEAVLVSAKAEWRQSAGDAEAAFEVDVSELSRARWLRCGRAGSAHPPLLHPTLQW